MLLYTCDFCKYGPVEDKEHPHGVFAVPKNWKQIRVGVEGLKNGVRYPYTQNFILCPDCCKKYKFTKDTTIYSRETLEDILQNLVVEIVEDTLSDRGLV